MIEVRRMRATDSELKSLICNLMVADDDTGRFTAKSFTIIEMTYLSINPVKLRVSGRFCDGRAITLTVTPDLLIASFVIFCTGQGIPISRKSIKTVAKVDDGIAFDMVVRNLEVTETASPDQIRYGFLPTGTDDLITNLGLHLK